jgi:hypothetical protein
MNRNVLFNEASLMEHSIIQIIEKFIICFIQYQNRLICFSGTIIIINGVNVNNIISEKYNPKYTELLGT